jgi:hypothetical protein
MEYNMETCRGQQSRDFSMDNRDFTIGGRSQTADFSMDVKESKEFGPERTPEEVVNSIKITEGPVTHMSMAVQKTSRTPYSDATQASTMRMLFSGTLKFQ